MKSLNFEQTKVVKIVFNFQRFCSGDSNLSAQLELYRTSSPVRYPAGFQENVLSGTRPDFLQRPDGYYLEIIILNYRNI